MAVCPSCSRWRVTVVIGAKGRPEHLPPLRVFREHACGRRVPVRAGSELREPK